MAAFTLRLEPDLSKKFDLLCRKKGFKKTGLINSLIQDFVERESQRSDKSKRNSKKMVTSIQDLVGIIHLGGDATDEEGLFE